MKKIFYLFCLLISTLGYSQQIVELCEGNKTTFTYSSNAGISGIYVWSIDGNDYIVSPLTYTWDTPGSYQIKLSFLSNGGCQDTTSYSVTVKECQETTLWFPNSFTPNDDTKNDTWSPKGFNYTDLDYSIFNRWGELIFKSTSESNPWDGKYKGVECQQDVYVYITTWKTRDRRVKREYGHIVLIR